MPVPTLGEQVEIAQRLDREENDAARTVSLLNRASDLLAEQRSALITAAVTGQIDVRSHAS